MEFLKCRICKKNDGRDVTNEAAPEKPEGNEKVKDSGQASYASISAALVQNDFYHQYDNAALEEDLFGMTIKSYFRDTAIIREEGLRSKAGQGHAVRLIWAFLLLAICIYSQLALMYYSKKYLTVKAVKEVRESYSDFEYVMYGSNEKNTIVNANGHYRGVQGNFNAAYFDDLDESLKHDVCHISLSQPYFLGTFLMLWSLVCLADLRTSLEQLQMFWEHPSLPHSSVEKIEVEDGEVIVMKGFKLKHKVILTILIIVPRIALTSCMLLIGSRWLTATTSFGDVFLNCVALAFILEIKDILYNTLVSAATKHELQQTQIKLAYEREEKGPWLFFRTKLWFFVAILWVYLFMFYFQHVLPDYKWDVHEVCESWLDEKYSL